MSHQKAQQTMLDRTVANAIMGRTHLPMQDHPARVTRAVVRLVLLGPRVHMREGKGYTAKSRHIGAGVYELWFEEVAE